MTMSQTNSFTKERYYGEGDMIANLVDTNDKLDLVTSAAADVDVVVAYADWDQSLGKPTASSPGKQLTTITTATTTDVCAAPGASTTRNVKNITIRNTHASTTTDITVRMNDNATIYELVKMTMLAGEVVVCREGVWFHYDSNGGVYGRALPIATQGDMETATNNTQAVTPLAVNWHPGVAKFWHRTTVSGGTPTLANSWNVTSITDTATGNLTVTIATDFSGVNYAVVGDVERANTTTTVANARNSNTRNATPAAGSFIQECWDKAATNNALADPATWYAVGYGDQ